MLYVLALLQTVELGSTESELTLPEPTVQILDSSLSGNRVRVRLGPPDAPWTGLLTLAIMGDGRFHTFYEGSRKDGDAG
ncbi:MAG TPA: hypothetical protein PLP42_19885 [Acidobacteriota bacterium]|nr:hypothetical protein [Acidobacteriota bacterium]